MLLFTLANIALAQAPSTAQLPDVVDVPPEQLQVWRSAQTDELRFTTTHINLGEGPLEVLATLSTGPCTIDGITYDDCTLSTQQVYDTENTSGSVIYTQPSGYAVFHPEHNHWHMSSVVDFLLVPGRVGSQADALVASGQAYTQSVSMGAKQSFCLIDFSKTDLVHANSTKVYHHCGEDPQLGPKQGISVGWADSYHQPTPGQSIDISGVPDGEYTLIFVADPLNHWLETDETNNNSWAEISLYTQGNNRHVSELAHNSCVEGLTCEIGGNK